MKKSQEVKQDSYKLIVKESKSNPASLALVPNFLNGVNRLDQITIEIDSFGIQQGKDLTGIKTDKEKTMVNLIDWTIDISGAVHSYAHANGNSTLMSRVDYKISDLKHLSQPELLLVAGIVLDEAQQIPADALSQEGISPEELSGYRDLITTFSNVKSSTKEAIIDRAGFTGNIGNLFTEANAIVKNSLDKLITQYKRKDPDFYRRYKAARGIKIPVAQKKVVVEDPAPVR